MIRPLRATRILKTLAGIGCGAVLLLASAVLAGLWWLQSSKGEAFATEQLTRIVQGSLEQGGFEVGAVRLRGDTMVVRDLTLKGAAGLGTLSVDSVRGELDKTSLLRSQIQLDDVEVSGVRIDLPRREDGALDLPLFTSSPGPTTYLPAGINLEIHDAIVRDVEVLLPDDALQLSNLGGTLDLEGDHDHLWIENLDLQGEALAPALGRLTLDGNVALQNADIESMDLQLGAGGSRVALAGGIPGALSETPSFELVADASVDRADLHELIVWSGNDEAAQMLKLEGGALGLQANLGGDLEAIELMESSLRLGETEVLQASGTLCTTEASCAPITELAAPVADLQLVSTEPGRLLAEVDVEASADRIEVPLQLSLTAEAPMELDATVRAQALRFGTLSVPEAEITIDGEVAPALQLEVQGAIPWVGVDAGGQTIPAGAAVDVTLTETEVRGGVTLRPYDLEDAVLRTGLAFDFASGRIRLPDLRLETPAGTVRAAGPVRARVVGEGLQDVRAELTVGDGQLVVDLARVDARYQTGIVEVTAVPLAVLGTLAEPYVEGLPSLTGILEGHVRLDVTPAQRLIQATAEVRPLDVEGMLERTDVSAVATLIDDTVELAIDAGPPKADALVEARLLSTVAPGGFVPTCEGTTTGTVTLAPTSVGQLDDHLVALRELDYAADLRATLEIEGDTCDPTLGLAAWVDGSYLDRPIGLAATLDDGPDHASVVGATVKLEDTEVLELKASAKHPEPTVWLQAEDWVEALRAWDLAAELKDVDLYALTGMVEGVLEGEISVAGDGLEPDRVEGSLQVLEPVVGERAVDAVTLELSTEGETLSAEAVLATGEQDLLRAQASTSLPALARDGMEAPFEARIPPSELPLELIATFAPQWLWEAEGTLELEARADGTLAQPDLSGSLGIDGGALTLAANGVRYTNLQLAASMQDDVLRIEKARSSSAPRYGRRGERSDDQNIQILGTVGVNDASIEPDLEVQLDGFWASATNEAQVEMSGNLSIEGSLLAPVVRGDLRVDEATLNLDRYVFIPPAGQNLHPDIEFVGDTPETLTTEAPEPSPLMRADVQLSVDAGRNTQLEASVPVAADAGALGKLSDAQLDADVEGEVDVGLQNGTPSVRGRVETEGSAEVLSARFDIERGVLAFEGRSYLAPQLDFVLRRDSNDFGAVTARVRGTPQALTIDELASDSGLSEADIVAQLLFGRPLSTLDGDQSGAGALAVQQALLDVAGGRLERAVGTNLVDAIDIGADNVALGWAVGDAGFVTVAVDPTAEQDENITEVELSLFLGSSTEAEIRTGDAADSAAWLLVEETF